MVSLVENLPADLVNHRAFDPFAYVGVSDDARNHPGLIPYLPGVNDDLPLSWGDSIEEFWANMVLHSRYSIERWFTTRAEGTQEAHAYPMNFAQVCMHALFIEDYEVRQIPLKMWVLKYRRLGADTWGRWVLTLYLRFNVSLYGMIIGHTGESAKTIFDTYVELDQDLNDPARSPLMFHRPLKNEGEKKANTETGRDYLEWLITNGNGGWKRGGSRLWRISAGSNAGSVGKTLDMCLYTELGMPANWDRITKWTNNALDHTGGRHFGLFQGTGENMGTYLQKMWALACDPSTAYVPLFMPWFQDPQTVMDIPRGQIAQPAGASTNDKRRDEKEMNRIRDVMYREWSITDYHGESREILEHRVERHMQWRQMFSMPNNNYDASSFNTQNPTTPEDAFSAPGRTIFDAARIKDRLAEIAKQAADPAFKGPFPHPFYTDIEIYEKLDPNGFYILTHDASDGNDSNIEILDHDPNCFHVYNLETLSLAARYHGWRTVDEQAERIMAAATYFRGRNNDIPVTLVIDTRENNGIYIANELKKRRYPDNRRPRLWRFKSTDPNGTADGKVGFIATGPSRNHSIKLAQRWIWEWDIPEPAIWAEIANFGYTDRKNTGRITERKAEGQDGFHDDDAMCVFMTMYVAECEGYRPIGITLDEQGRTPDAVAEEQRKAQEDVVASMYPHLGETLRREIIDQGYIPADIHMRNRKQREPTDEDNHTTRHASPDDPMYAWMGNSMRVAG